MGGDLSPLPKKAFGNLRQFDLSQLSKREEGDGVGVGAIGIEWRLNMPEYTR